MHPLRNNQSDKDTTASNLPDLIRTHNLLKLVGVTGLLPSAILLITTASLEGPTGEVGELMKEIKSHGERTVSMDNDIELASQLPKSCLPFSPVGPSSEAVVSKSNMQWHWLHRAGSEALNVSCTLRRKL